MEGFAEWVSYKVLQLLKHKKQIEKSERNQYKDYAKGLEFFRNIEKKKGIKAVFDYVKTHNHT